MRELAQNSYCVFDSEKCDECNRHQKYTQFDCSCASLNLLIENSETICKEKQTLIASDSESDSEKMPDPRNA